MPADYRRFGERWAELNPDFEIHDWTEDEILAESWRNRDVIDDLYRRDAGRRTIALFAQVADVVDYELIFRFGGVYVNADIEPIRPLELMDAFYEPAGRDWVAREDERYVVNAAMGGAAGSPFFGDVIDRLGPRYFAEPGGPMNRTTGPGLLTDVVADHPDVVQLPVVAFNAHHWRTIRRGSDASGRKIPREAIGVHHWGHRRDGRSNRIEKG